jgi:hypothetical protein
MLLRTLQLACSYLMKYRFLTHLECFLLEHCFEDVVELDAMEYKDAVLEH